MFRALLLSLPLVLTTLPLAPPAFAAQEAKEKEPCKLSEGKKMGSKILGGMLGGLANRTVGRTGVGNFISLNQFTTTLTDAIACRLDMDEQKKAAKATDAVVTRGVGASESWKSDTRKGVTGTSTVTAQAKQGDGADCMTIEDVIIVEGEETIATKRMCRAVGGSGYALV